MNLFSHRAARAFWGVLLLASIAGGCRTYGGYGTEAALLGQIQQTNDLFAEEIQRAQGDLAALQRAAASDPALARFAEAYATLIDVQVAMLEEHRAMAGEAAEHRGNYRLLNRTYGAIITDQQVVRDRYAEILADMQRVVDGRAARPVPLESRYQIAPQFYERIGYANERLSLAEILDAARTSEAPPRPE